MSHLRRALLAFVLLIINSHLALAANLAIIPQPLQLDRLDGAFRLERNTLIVVDDSTRDLGAYLVDQISPALGFRPAITEAPYAGPPVSIIELKLIPEADEPASEGYRLLSTPARVTISAPRPVGIFYGLQTLRQLLPPGIESSEEVADAEWLVPCVRIEDRPRFSWRGLMLDCSRTFQSLDYIRATINRIAFYKQNVLHLHLTDDQGWRLEIRKYPQLTQRGARFPDRYEQPDSMHGFYTQEQMRQLVEYARRRGVTIVPEIEMPGHSLAILSCYPELSCTGGPFEIFPFFRGPGITADILCAGNDDVFEFIEDVLTEVVDIFPSTFIHIGGDEAPKTRWSQCPKCQARMRDESLEDEHELQSYFARRVERFLSTKGRRLIGWDEILEGGLAPDATVMSWRGMAGGINAARAGHDVVMSPTSHCYFDYSYSSIDTRRAYSFEPVPAQLTADESRHILGLQANFWSHIHRRPELVDRQLFPRLIAIAERAWSPADTRDWEAFQTRLTAHLPRLRAMGVNYKRPPIGRWAPDQMSEEYQVMSWDVAAAVRGAGAYRAELHYTHGAHRLDIEWVELAANGQTVARDTHYAQTGASHSDNVYRLAVESYDEEARYELRASACSDGGTDSNGEVAFEKEDGGQ